MIYLILKEDKYKGCRYYIRRLDNIFEFLVLYNNELYSEYIVIVPNFLNALKTEPHSKQVVKNSATIMIKRARDLIDELLKSKK